MSEQKRISIVFFGTPQIAVPVLDALAKDSRFEVTACVTQTDKPSGRGQKLQPSPVKAFASDNGIKVFQPISLKKTERADGLYEFLDIQSADFFIVVAYGKIIPGMLLERTKKASINIHFSLLPRWRGAAPLQRAILAGDTVTGIDIMHMEEGLDTGAVYLEEKLEIQPEDTTGTLGEKLALLGARLLPDALIQIYSNELQGIPQSTEGVTYAEKLKPADFLICWEEPAAVVAQRIQAASPFPGAKASFNGETVKLFDARPVSRLGQGQASPGTIVETNAREILFQAGDNALLAVSELQFPNRKRLPVCEIVKSLALPPGSRFGVIS